MKCWMVLLGLALVPAPAAQAQETGRIAGVVSSGEPGYDGTVIRIRGNHSLNDDDPLIVIDGGASQRGGCEKGGAACE